MLDEILRFLVSEINEINGVTAYINVVPQNLKNVVSIKTLPNDQIRSLKTGEPKYYNQDFKLVFRGTEDEINNYLLCDEIVSKLQNITDFTNITLNNTNIIVTMISSPSFAYTDNKISNLFMNLNVKYNTK